MEKDVSGIHWRAIYKSGEILEQEGSSIDVLYDNIDKENLKQFHLLGLPLDIGVDVENGCLVLNGVEVVLKGFSNQKTNYRLVYYVNSRQVVGSNREPDKTYSLGLQANISSKNEKVLINLSRNGMFIRWGR